MAARALVSNRTSGTLSKALLQSLGWCSFNRTVGAVVAIRALSTDASTAGDKTINVERRPDTAHAPARRGRGRDSALAQTRRGRGDDYLPAFFSDPSALLNPGRTLSQVLNFMDQLMGVPFGARGVLHTGWDAREDDKALYLKVEMPGLGKEDVKVWLEGNTLVIKGEKEEEDGNGSEEGGTSTTTAEGRTQRRYSSRIEIPERGYKLDQIKAEMKHGVLRVVIPKAPEEERRDVREVPIEG